MVQSSPAPDHTADDKAPPAPSPEHALLRDMLVAMEGIVAHVPSLHAMHARITAMHAKLDALIAPPAAKK